MRVTTSAWIEPDTVIEVNAPRGGVSEVTGEPLRVPWLVSFARYQVTWHVEDREVLTKLRDAITAALDANPDAS